MARTYKPVVQPPRPCECGCGREVTGRSTKKYATPYCKKKVLTKTRQAREHRAMVYAEFMNAMKRSYSRINFTQFCVLLGERETINGQPNDYAYLAWQRFRVASENIGYLGNHWHKLIEWGMQDGTGS